MLFGDFIVQKDDKHGVYLIEDTHKEQCVKIPFTYMGTICRKVLENKI